MTWSLEFLCPGFFYLWQVFIVLLFEEMLLAVDPCLVIEDRFWVQEVAFDEASDLLQRLVLVHGDQVRIAVHVRIGAMLVLRRSPE